MDAVLTLTSKNQITIPASIANFLKLKKGSKLWAKIVGDSVVLEKSKDTWKNLHGFLSENPIAKKYSYEKVHEMAEEAEAKRLMKND